METSTSSRAELAFAVFINKSSSHSRISCKQPTQSPVSQLAVVGFEPTPPERLEPKSSALDHSATLPFKTSVYKTNRTRLDEKSTLTTIGQSNRRHTWKNIQNFKHIPCGSIELYSRSKDHKTIRQFKGLNSWVYSATFSTSKTKASHFQQEVSSCLEGKDKGDIAVNMGVDKGFP